jgi:hypothetical protein
MTRLLALLDDEVYKQVVDNNRRFDRKYQFYGRIEIVLVGGAVVILHDIRLDSGDIDSAWRTDKYLRFVMPAVKRISERENIGIKWFNEDFTNTNCFTPNIYNKKDLIPWRSGKVLDIYMIDLRFLLCMKLIAFRQRKDKDDIKDALGIITVLRRSGFVVNEVTVGDWFKYYYGNRRRYTTRAKEFIRSIQ